MTLDDFCCPHFIANTENVGADATANFIGMSANAVKGDNVDCRVNKLNQVAEQYVQRDLTDYALSVPITVGGQVKEEIEASISLENINPTIYDNSCENEYLLNVLEDPIQTTSSYPLTSAEKEKRKEAQRKYLKSEKGKAKKRAYNATERRREASRKYNQSEKGKARMRAYYSTEKRKESVRKYKVNRKARNASKSHQGPVRKYSSSEKDKAGIKTYLDAKRAKMKKNAGQAFDIIQKREQTKTIGQK